MLERDAVSTTVKRIIDSIKPLEPGFDELRDDDPLFDFDAGRPSPVKLDSLDALDLSMCLSEEFGLDNEEFERLVESENGLRSLRTVNDITDLILSLSRSDSGRMGHAASNLQGKEVRHD